MDPIKLFEELLELMAEVENSPSPEAWQIERIGARLAVLEQETARLERPGETPGLQ